MVDNEESDFDHVVESSFFASIIFDHTSNFSIIWEHVRILMCLVSTYIYIYGCVFSVEEIIKGNQLLGFNVEYWIETYFFLNILKNFWTTCTTKNSFMKITNPFIIAGEYF